MLQDPAKAITWPHAEGITRLVFSPDGAYLYTSGAEGLMRVFDARLGDVDLSDPKLIEYHEEPMTSLSATNEYVCSANESGVVALHRSGTNEFVELVTRCNIPVRSARFDPKGRRIAVASDELIVKVIDAKDPLKVQLLAGHKKGVREATWSPDGSHLTTSGSDGQIRVWELSGSEPTCIQVLDGIITAADPENEYTVEVVWHPSGSYFVVASKTNEIVVVSRDTWTKTSTFSAPDGHNGAISALAFSKNGAYLSSAAKDGLIIVWSTSSRQPIQRTTHNAGLVTALAFHPASTANELAYTDFTGQLIRWTGPVPTGMTGPSVVVARSRSRSGSIEAAPAPAARKEADGSDGEDVVSEFGGELNDWIDDDNGDGMAEHAYGGEPVPKRISAWNGGSYVPTSKGQPPFQPGATVGREKRRYMGPPPSLLPRSLLTLLSSIAFNMLGFIHLVERDDSNIVTIEFHDRSSHTGSHFNDPHNFNLAALGELGSVFSCPSNGDSPSIIHYRPEESWTSVAEWTYSLPPRENATVLAVGGIEEPLEYGDVGIAGTGTVLVATDKGFVRFLSGSGLQKYVWNLGEEVVSMAAGKDWAMVVWRAGAAVEGRQNLEYSVVDTDTFEMVQQGRLPLGKGATVLWVGMTNDQIPVMYDSTGLLSLLDRSRRPRQGRWVPALDMSQLARKQGKQESYWPIGVTEQHVHIIILKGSEKEPHFPTPLFQEIDLQFPLLRLDAAQGQLEEQYLRETTFVSHRRDGAAPDDYTLKSLLARQEMETDKHLLKIIQTSCKGEKLQAALDAALLLTQPASLDAAAKIAGFFDLPGLQERIVLVKESKSGRREAEDENKRGGKWAHLVDDRTVPSINTTRHANGATGNGMFSNADDSYASPRSSFVSTAPFGTARKLFTPAPSRRTQVEPEEGSEVGEGEEMLVDEEEEDGEDEGAVVRKRSRSVSDEGEEAGYVEEPEEMEGDMEAPESIPKKAANPFVKRAPAVKTGPIPSSPNPFATKTKGSKAVDLQRTDSFFGRVEGKVATKGKKSTTKASTSTSTSTSAVPSITVAGSRQTTLFGLAPGVPKPTDKKKRKVASASDDESEETQSKTKGKGKKVGGLASFLKGAKELPREGEEFEETQVEEETQETQARKKKAESQGEEEAQEETQVEETQMEEEEEEEEESEVAVPSTAAPKRVSPPPAMDGISKLAQFRMAAAAST